jgi:uncharacterized membrane protein YgcG
MNKKTSVTMAAAIAVAGILTLAVLAVAIPHQAFAASSNPCRYVAAGGVNIVKTSASLSSSGSIDQKANGGDANGGHGGNANGGDAST